MYPHSHKHITHMCKEPKLRTYSHIAIFAYSLRNAQTYLHIHARNQRIHNTRAYGNTGMHTVTHALTTYIHN